MATGGLRQKRALNTVEVFDPKRPKVSSGDRSKGDLHSTSETQNSFILCQAGWKKLSKLKMPAAVSEHCAVTLKGLLVHFLGNK